MVHGMWVLVFLALYLLLSLSSFFVCENKGKGVSGLLYLLLGWIEVFCFLCPGTMCKKFIYLQNLCFGNLFVSLYVRVGKLRMMFNQNCREG